MRGTCKEHRDRQKADPLMLPPPPICYMGVPIFGTPPKKLIKQIRKTWNDGKKSLS